MPGIDIGLNLNARDKGAAKTTDGKNYQTDIQVSNHPTDVRVKFGLAATYKKFGITAAFAYGLTNYAPVVVYYPPTVPYNDGKYDSKAHSELLRFGLSYRIF
jgi:hypothetical protein